MSFNRGQVTAKLKGIMPPCVLPFEENGDVAYSKIPGVVDWYVNAGVHGLTPLGSLGEGHVVSDAEVTNVMTAMGEAIDGRVATIAGVISNSTKTAIERIKSVEHLSIDAIQVTPVHYLWAPDENETVEHFRVMAEETGKPLIIYNVIPWNYLTPETCLRIIDEVPGVIGLKQSQNDLGLLAQLMIGIPDDAIVYSAIDSLLYLSFKLGAHGSISLFPAFLPQAVVTLWEEVQAGNDQFGMEMHKRMLRLFRTFDHYPSMVASVKFLLSQQGVDAGLPRGPYVNPTEQAKEAMMQALQPLLPDAISELRRTTSAKGTQAA